MVLAGAWTPPAARGRLALRGGCPPTRTPTGSTPRRTDLGRGRRRPAVDAVAVDGDDPDLAALLPELRGERPAAAPADGRAAGPELVRAARAAADAADAVVGLVARCEPWAPGGARPAAGGRPPLQVTVRGWPRGRQAAAELVDLAAPGAARWPPSPPPRRRCRPPSCRRCAGRLGAAHGSGATVLVSHEDGRRWSAVVRQRPAGGRARGRPLGRRRALPLLPPRPGCRPDGAPPAGGAAAPALAGRRAARTCRPRTGPGRRPRRPAGRRPGARGAAHVAPAEQLVPVA
jgi:hypothetical protein